MIVMILNRLKRESTMTSANINLKLAEIFGIETQYLSKFSLFVIPGEFPEIHAEYIMPDSPPGMILKKTLIKSIKSLEDANT